MRALKLFVLMMFLFASLGLAACGDGDLSGTAGDTEGIGDPIGEEPPSRENPEEPPSNAGGDNASPSEPGEGSGDNNASRDTSEQSTDQFLASLPATQRVDFDYIAERCNGCMDVADLRAYVEQACESDPRACSDEFKTLLTKQRTTTQIRNDQGLVGLPNAEDVLAVYQSYRDGVPPSDAAPGNAGNAGDEAGGDEAGGEAGGDTGGDGGDEAGGDTGGEGDDSVEIGAERPETPSREAQNVLAAMNDIATDTVSWTDVANVADAASVDALGTHFQELATDPTGSPMCDEACVAMVQELLAGQDVLRTELMELLNRISGG